MVENLLALLSLLSIAAVMTGLIRKFALSRG